MHSPKWLKNKKATMDLKDNDGKCVQYAQTVALNNKQINKVFNHNCRMVQ